MTLGKIKIFDGEKTLVFSYDEEFINHQGLQNMIEDGIKKLSNSYNKLDKNYQSYISRTNDKIIENDLLTRENIELKEELERIKKLYNHKDLDKDLKNDFKKANRLIEIGKEISKLIKEIHKLRKK